MKRIITIFALVLLSVAVANANTTDRSRSQNYNNNDVTVGNELNANQYQNVSVVGGGDSTSISQGGDASADSKSTSTSNATIDTTSISNYETRTPPLTVFPPYLPYWSHGGWGTIKGYFHNGPNSDDTVYERVFNPEDERDMKELRGVLTSIPHKGPLEFIGGVFNGVGACFGGPDNFHRGRGFEISNSLFRARRPKGKPLLVFIDSNVDREQLKKAGYAYVGQVSIEGEMDQNWDYVYDAAVAETLPWDVDILLVSGGMKGVTVGSNISFPGAAGAYSQTNYSVSLFGSVSTGITEGKAEAVLSAEAYRFWPDAAFRRQIPLAIYNNIRKRPEAQQTNQRGQVVPEQQPQYQPQYIPPETESRGSVGSTDTVQTRRSYQGVHVSQELLDMAGF